MICQICGKHNASMLVQQIVGGKAKALYMCRSCAKKHNLFADERQMHLSLKALFDDVAPSSERAEDISPGSEVTVCPECGTPLSRIKEKRTIGCSRCFFYFRNTVVKLMQEAQDEIFYSGTLPDQLETFSGAALSMQQLEAELKRAVENEEFELAAYYRDRIKEREASS